MKVLFLYIPAGGATVKRCMVMPVGVPALADLMSRAKHDVSILHTGVETALNKRFDVAGAVAEYAPDVVAMPLHFHHQLAAVGDVVKKVKKAAPDVRIVLGGFTASFFHKEIMEKWPGADFVVRGDGEAPMYQLARALEGKGNLRGVPNLSFRSDGEIRHNEFSYAADETVLGKLRFGNLALMKHNDSYGGGFTWREKDGLAAYLKNRSFYLCGGRGCSVSCAYCAGAASSQKGISCRDKPLMRSAHGLFDDVRELMKYGRDAFYLCFDPPRRGCEPYGEFMELLRNSNTSVSMVFEYYNRLTSRNFIGAFSETFMQGNSAVVFSPATANEDARRLYNGCYYSNSALEKSLAACAGRGVNTVLYFTIFPGENMAAVKRSVGWAQRLSEKFGSEILFMPIEMEPGAPWHESPEKFGIMPTRVSFDDFVEESRRRDFAKFPADPGYRFPGYVKKLEYIRAKGLLAEDYELPE